MRTAHPCVSVAKRRMSALLRTSRRPLLPMAQSRVTETMASMATPLPSSPRRHQLTLDGDGDVFDLKTVRIVLNNEVVGREVIEVRDLGVE